ncbi:MAG: hypothetical protein K8I30_16260, partial [Anaerolineae bacterium]|nr:hypothetical protein [Anaerolineae bacterium]
VTLSVAVLAGFGADDLTQMVIASRRYSTAHVRTQRFGIILMVVGTAVLLLTRLSIFLYPQLEPVIDRVFHSLAKAPEAFSDVRMFFSYQYTNVMTFGLFTLAAGAVFWWAGQHTIRLFYIASIPQHRIWQIFTGAVIVVDLMAASWGFNPASDPLLLDFTPPAVQWLQQQPGQWRYTTLDDPTRPPIMNANMGWRYGLYDIRGYESIIPKQYVDYMERIAPQIQLDFNRVAPFYTDPNFHHLNNYHMALDAPLFDLLNVRYVITHKDVWVAFQEWRLAYEDEAVRIWENDSMVPRAYTVAPDDISLTADLDWLAIPRKPQKIPAEFTPAAISHDTGREKIIDVTVNTPAMLVVSETFLPGWRAYRQMPNGDETPLDVQLVQGNFQGVPLTEAGTYMIRMVYSPVSFQIGAFASFISAVLVVFLLGVWGWRLWVAPPTEQQASGASRVARNSLAPIILNLFNRGIDFAFAAVMLRVLGP